MTDQELDQLMQRVLLDAIKSDCRNMSCEIPNFMLSHRYQHQMAIMIANPLKWARKRARPLWKKVLQRVAVILIVFSLSLGSLMIISPSVRAAVVNWVTEWYETHITYRYSGSPISGEMPQYEIVELPDGYVEVEEQALYGANYVYKTYYNEDTDRTMFFNYVYMQQGFAWDYFTENVEVIPVSVHGMKGQMFLTDDWEHEQNTITWIDAQNNIQFSIDGNFDADDILHIAESVSLVNSTK